MSQLHSSLKFGHPCGVQGGEEDAAECKKSTCFSFFRGQDNRFCNQSQLEYQQRSSRYWMKMASTPREVRRGHSWMSSKSNVRKSMFILPLSLLTVMDMDSVFHPEFNILDVPIWYPYHAAQEVAAVLREKLITANRDLIVPKSRLGNWRWICWMIIWVWRRVPRLFWRQVGFL